MSDLDDAITLRRQATYLQGLADRLDPPKPATKKVVRFSLDLDPDDYIKPEHRERYAGSASAEDLRDTMRYDQWVEVQCPGMIPRKARLIQSAAVEVLA